MNHDAFQYSFTIKELFYFLFKKKVCPICGREMEKQKKYESVEGSTLNSKSSAFFIQNAKVKKYIYFFYCPDCKSGFSLCELSNNKQIKKRGD